MGAEETTSSLSRTNGRDEVRQAEFRLHCFPNLPVEESMVGYRCTRLGEHFQRSNFSNGDARSSSDRPIGAEDYALHQSKPLSFTDIEADAYREGFAAGERKGLVQGEKSGFESGLKKIEPLLHSLQEAILQCTRIRKETYVRIEEEVVDLALAVAKKVICREVQTDRNIVIDVVREALAKVAEAGRIKIKMNPAELKFINEMKTHLADMVQQFDHAVFEADEGVPSGGCIIETDSGAIDARIEQQLQAVEEMFRAEMEKLNLKGLPE
jgi:flagellar biosynthesis/type III secretory pathway protein FliH